MRYLVDTDWVADWLGERAPAVRLLQLLEGEGLSISLITYGEIYDGIYHGANSATHEAGFLDLLRRIPVLSLDQEIMRRFARLRGDLRRRGRLIGDPDILIAASAIHHDLTLVTRNLDHVRRFPGLRRYDLETRGA